MGFGSSLCPRGSLRLLSFFFFLLSLYHILTIRTDSEPGNGCLWLPALPFSIVAVYCFLVTLLEGRRVGKRRSKQLQQSLATCTVTAREGPYELHEDCSIRRRLRTYCRHTPSHRPYRQNDRHHERLQQQQAEKGPPSESHRKRRLSVSVLS